MSETIVHVTTLEQWKSVLDVWFKQGYSWYTKATGYNENYFFNGERHLLLNHDNDILKPTWGRKSIEYSEFMEQQKDGNKMAMVYEVSQSVFDELQRIKAHYGTSLIGAITLNAQLIKSIDVGNKTILRYLSDDPAIEFKVKEQLYRLWAIDDFGDRVYFKKSHGFWTVPSTQDQEDILTAPLEEIKKWKTPDWNLENVE